MTTRTNEMLLHCLFAVVLISEKTIFKMNQMKNKQTKKTKENKNNVKED